MFQDDEAPAQKEVGQVKDSDIFNSRPAMTTDPTADFTSVGVFVHVV